MLRLIVWFVLGAAIVGAIAGMLGSGPERIRVLLWFPVGFGLATGGALAFAARESGVRPPWLVTVLSCVLVAGGLVFVAWAAYRELVDLAEQRVREDSQQLLGLRLLKEQADADPTQLKPYRERRMAVDPQFEDYLMGRVSALGVWRTPWPAVIWVVEMLTATTATGWLVWRMVSRPPSERGIRGKERLATGDTPQTTDNEEPS